MTKTEAASHEWLKKNRRVEDIAIAVNCCYATAREGISMARAKRRAEMIRRGEFKPTAARGFDDSVLGAVERPSQDYKPLDFNRERSTKAKKLAIEQLLEANPPILGQSQNAHAKMIAAKAGCSVSYVDHIKQIEKAKKIGEAIRAEERAKQLPVLSDGQGAWGKAELDIVRNFRGWRDAFSRLKMVTDVYVEIAKSKDCVWAESFMLGVKELCEKAQFRASKERIV